MILIDGHLNPGDGKDIGQLTNSDSGGPAPRKISPSVVDRLDVHRSITVCTQADGPSQALTEGGLKKAGNNHQRIEKQNTVVVVGVEVESFQSCKQTVHGLHHRHDCKASFSNVDHPS